MKAVTANRLSDGVVLYLGPDGDFVERLEHAALFEEAAAIWENLLKYFEPTKKPVECTPEKSSPEESVDAAEETFKLLQELEQHGIEPIKSSEGDGLAKGPVVIPSETSPKTDLPGHTEQ